MTGSLLVLLQLASFLLTILNHYERGYVWLVNLI